MFCNTASGAETSAIFYSLIETAKVYGLTPFNYLMFLLEELSKQPEDLDYLMPWNNANYLYFPSLDEVFSIKNERLANLLRLNDFVSCMR